MLLLKKMATPKGPGPRHIRLIVLTEDGSAKDITVPDRLEEYQAIVGGYIESFGRCVDGLNRFCNEDGRALGLKHNIWSGFLGTDVVGKVFLCRTKGDEFDSINDEDLLRWEAWSRGEKVRVADLRGP